MDTTEDYPQTPLHCVTSILARAFLSVETGCDPNGYYMEQNLLNTINGVENYWRNHGNSWGQIENEASITPNPELRLMINSEYVGPQFAEFADRYVFGDFGVSTTEDFGYFSMASYAIDYQDFWNLVIRCRKSNDVCIQQTLIGSCNPGPPAN